MEVKMRVFLLAVSFVFLFALSSCSVSENNSQTDENPVFQDDSNDDDQVAGNDAQTETRDENSDTSESVDDEQIDGMTDEVTDEMTDETVDESVETEDADYTGGEIPDEDPEVSEECVEITSMTYEASSSWTGHYKLSFEPSVGEEEEFDYIAMNFYGPQGTGSFDLGTAPNDDMSTCNQCVTIFQDVQSDGMPKRYYLVTKGTLVIEKVELNEGGNMSGASKGYILNAQFQEAMLNPESHLVEKIPDGECIGIGKLSWDNY
jgi:hypothetical protein